MSRGRALRLTAAAIGIALGVAGWFLLAPRALGGRLSYVVVARGTSMEPTFHTGDLALVRPAETYVPGQVVAYQSRDLGSTVLHRIVERNGDGYVLKGDNNSFLDPERPRDEDILGALWIRVPIAGSVMGWFRQPLNAAMVAGVAVFLTVVFAEGRRRGSTRQRHRHAASRDRPTSSGSARSRLGVAATAAAVFLLLGVIAFSRPTSTTQTEELPYRHTSSFSYEADVSPGPVYADGAVRTGDPLFLRLVDAVDVTYGYALDGEATGVKGSARLFVEISDTNGWKRSMELKPETPFTGPAFQTQGRVDVRDLRRLVRSVERATGVIPDAYTVRLGADVRVDGLLGGVTIADTFSPRVDFRLDALQLQVAQGEGGSDPFNPAIKSTVRRQVAVPNRITLVGIGISVRAVRLVTMLGSVVSLLFLAFFGLAELRSLRGGEASRINARYGPWLVPVREIDGSVPVADVERFEDLFRVADRSERMILHEERDGTHTYVVEDGKLLLRYRIQDEASVPTPAATEEAPTTDVTIPSPSPQLEERVANQAEVIEPAILEKETEEAPVVPATPPVTWSDGWAVGPARKR